MLTFLSVCNELWVVRPLLPLRELKLTSSREVCRPEVREVLRRGVRLVRPPLAIPDGADCPQQKAHRRQLQEHPDLTFLVAIPRLPSPSTVLRQLGVRTANFPPLRISRKHLLPATCPRRSQRSSSLPAQGSRSALASQRLRSPPLDPLRPPVRSLLDGSSFLGQGSWRGDKRVAWYALGTSVRPPSSSSKITRRMDGD